LQVSHVSKVFETEGQAELKSRCNRIQTACALQAAIRDGFVRVNDGVPSKPGLALRPGDIVACRLPPLPSMEASPEVTHRTHKHLGGQLSISCVVFDAHDGARSFSSTERYPTALVQAFLRHVQQQQLCHAVLVMCGIILSRDLVLRNCCNGWGANSTKPELRRRIVSTSVTHSRIP
jgi:hypothetical protein